MMTTAAVRLVLPARPENVAVVRQAVAGVASALGVEDRVVADMKMAVSEACANVVIHAYDRGEGRIEVDLEPGVATLTVVVRDRGHGVRPRLDPEGTNLGLGLPLMASLADEFEVRTGDPAGTEVRMAFELVRSDGDRS
jgi:serine/threonine-protein kinase RsbW